MARLVACYRAHQPGCLGDGPINVPCECGAQRLVVDVEFDVPPGATVREALLLARRAGGMEALRIVAEELS